MCDIERFPRYIAQLKRKIEEGQIMSEEGNKIDVFVFTCICIKKNRQETEENRSKGSAGIPLCIILTFEPFECP
jgi:hypothetical protein